MNKAYFATGYFLGVIITALLYSAPAGTARIVAGVSLIVLFLVGMIVADHDDLKSYLKRKV